MDRHRDAGLVKRNILSGVLRPTKRCRLECGTAQIIDTHDHDTSRPNWEGDRYVLGGARAQPGADAVPIAQCTQDQGRG